MWEITKNGQIINCIIGFVLGAVIGVVISVFLPLYKRIKRKIIRDIFDCSVFIVVAILNIFVFYALTNGIVRYYIIFFEVVGFTLIRFTICGIISRVSGEFFGLVLLIFNRVLYFAQKLCEKCLKILVKTLKKVKKLLKNIYDMLYTISCKRSTQKK